MATSKKEHTKKESHSAHKGRRRRKKQSMPIAPILIGVLLVAALAWIVYSNVAGGPSTPAAPGDEGIQDGMQDQQPSGDDTESPGEGTQGVTAAKVNGAVISVQQVESQYDILPAYMRGSVTYEDILNSTIDKTLLTQTAEDEGIEVTDQEVDALLQQFMSQRGITRETLDQQLAANNMTYEDLREDYKNEFMIQRLFNQSGVLEVNVSDEAVQAYYEENRNESPIHVPQQVRARHILVNTSDEADEVMEKLNEGQSFEALAQEYSTDTGSASKGGDLGYVQQGRMVEPFDQAIFNMSVEEDPRIIETRFGYHIVDVTGIREERTKPLSEVRETIVNQLSQQLQQQAVEAYVDRLRENADIEVYWDRLPDEPEQEGPAIQLQ